MRALDLVMAVAAVLTATPQVHAAQAAQVAQLPSSVTSFEKLAAECAPDVHPTTLKGLVTTESSGNPYAIGVVGGRLERQPRSHAEAVAAVRELERKGFNFSMGLGQVNRYNLAKYGETYETIFEPCRNLKAGGAILKDCYQRAKAKLGDEQDSLRAAFSCYYSGNFTRGFKPDSAGQPSYVQKVVANSIDVARIVPAVQPQLGDGALPVRATATPSAKARTRTAAASAGNASPSQWVVFAGVQSREATPAPPQDSAVNVRLETPGNGAMPPAAVAPPSMPVSARSSPDSVAQDAPFVQFVN